MKCTPARVALGVLLTRGYQTMKDDDFSTDGNEAGHGMATGGKENVSTSVPPATMPENKVRRTHEHSHAAHLETDQEKPHTKPAIDMRESKLPGKRKEP